MTVLRVTEAIKLCGLIDDEWANEFALKRGTYVHEVTALDDLGDLDERSVDPVHVFPHLESYRLWRDLQKPEILRVEYEVANEAMGYRGRLDRLLKLHGLLYVVDIKSGAPSDWHPYQTALYAMAYAAEHGGATPARACLYTRSDAKIAKFEVHKDRRDFERAKALITVAHLKRELGYAA